MASILRIAAGVAVALVLTPLGGSGGATGSGLYGTVKRIENGELQLEIAPEVVVRVARRAVAAILTEKGNTELEAAEPPEEGDATLPSA